MDDGIACGDECQSLRTGKISLIFVLGMEMEKALSYHITSLPIILLAAVVTFLFSLTPWLLTRWFKQSSVDYLNVSLASVGSKDLRDFDISSPFVDSVVTLGRNCVWCFSQYYVA